MRLLYEEEVQIIRVEVKVLVIGEVYPRKSIPQSRGSQKETDEVDLRICQWNKNDRKGDYSSM